MELSFASHGNDQHEMEFCLHIAIIDAGGDFDIAVAEGISAVSYGEMIS